MNSDTKLLAMDFDGVIADSIMECAVAAYNGYANYNNMSKSIISPQDIDPYQLSVFIATRPFIHSGEDYIYLFQAMNESVNIDSQKDFDEFQMVYIDRKETYYQLFYSARQTLMLSNRDNWIALNPLYSGMSEFLQSMQNKIHIVSTKASKYIVEILRSNGVTFNPGRVYEASRGLSKYNIIVNLMQDYNLSTASIIFIDDHLDTLHKVKSTGVRCMLAGWGYNTEEQRVRCHENNLELVDIQQFYKEFDVV